MPGQRSKTRRGQVSSVRPGEFNEVRRGQLGLVRPGSALRLVESNEAKGEPNEVRIAQ